jgi:hypothetical protein
VPDLRLRIVFRECVLGLWGVNCPMLVASMRVPRVRRAEHHGVRVWTGRWHIIIS